MQYVIVCGVWKVQDYFLRCYWLPSCLPFISFNTVALCIETAFLNDVGVVCTAFWTVVTQYKRSFLLGEYLCVCLFFRPGSNDQTVCQIFVNAVYEFYIKTCRNNYEFLENRLTYTGAIPAVPTCLHLFGWIPYWRSPMNAVERLWVLWRST